MPRRQALEVARVRQRAITLASSYISLSSCERWQDALPTINTDRGPGGRIYSRQYLGAYEMVEALSAIPSIVDIVCDISFQRDCRKDTPSLQLLVFQDTLQGNPFGVQERPHAPQALLGVAYLHLKLCRIGC
jgi:hypothetical protein